MFVISNFYSCVVYDLQSTIERPILSILRFLTKLVCSFRRGPRRIRGVPVRALRSIYSFLLLVVLVFGVTKVSEWMGSTQAQSLAELASIGDLSEL